MKPNNTQFRKDLKKVTCVMVYAGATNDYFHITKKEALETAKRNKIYYRIIDTVFMNRRNVILIR